MEDGAMDYRIVIELRDVADGDVSATAQRIWDEHAEENDAARGDFTLRVYRLQAGGGAFETDLNPQTD
jgi:hypothetical protein